MKKLGNSVLPKIVTALYVLMQITLAKLIFYNMYTAWNIL